MGWFASLFGNEDSETGVPAEGSHADAPSRDPFGRIVAEPVFDAFRSAWKAGAGLFDLFGSEPVKIKERVGPDAPNRRPDVAKVETFLDRTGHLDLSKTEGPTGYYGSRVDQGIRRFQKDNALKVDGLINPDGETLRRLGAVLSEPEPPSLQATGLSPMIGPAFAPTELPPRMPEPAQAAASPLQARVADWLGRKGALLVGGRDSAAPPPLPSGVQRTATDADGAESAQPPASSPPSGSRTGTWFEGGLIPDTAGQDNPAAAEKYMRGKIERWRREGLNDAADNLQRYLDGKGGIVPLSGDEARKFKHVREGEIENNRRFVEQTFVARNTDEKTALALRDLKDGETLEVSDRWDSDYRLRHAGLDYLFGHANFALAYGANKLRSEGKFTAKRHGDTIIIDGTIRHTWEEPYNFETGQPGAAEGHTLERHGKAKPYCSIARWEPPVRAVVRIRGGRLSAVEAVRWGEIRDFRQAPAQ